MYESRLFSWNDNLRLQQVSQKVKNQTNQKSSFFNGLKWLWNCVPNDANQTEKMHKYWY
jgi:hypothetical protein